LCAAVATAASAQAQIQFLTDDPGLDAPILVEASVAPVPARAGEYGRLTVEVRLKQPWYIYSFLSDPLSGPPPRVEFSSAAIEALDGRYETRPVDKLDVATGTAQKYHAGPARLYADLRIKPGARPGAHPLTGSLIYAACDGKICLPMRKQPFVTEVVVEQGGPRWPFDQPLPPPSP
jgi:hypothetical protein